MRFGRVQQRHLACAEMRAGGHSPVVGKSWFFPSWGKRNIEARASDHSTGTLETKHAISSVVDQ
jgi:hypothetical protein